MTFSQLAAQVTKGFPQEANERYDQPLVGDGVVHSFLFRWIDLLGELVLSISPVFQLKYATTKPLTNVLRLFLDVSFKFIFIFEIQIQEGYFEILLTIKNFVKVRNF